MADPVIQGVDEMDVDGDGRADFRITVEDHDLLGTTRCASLYIGMAGWIL